MTSRAPSSGTTSIVDVLPLPEGAENQNGDDRRPSSRYDGAQKNPESARPLGISGVLDVDEGIADHGTGRSTHQNRGECDGSGQRRGQRGERSFVVHGSIVGSRCERAGSDGGDE